MDFCGFWLVSANSLKSGGDDDAAEPGGHAGGGRLGLRGVPGRVEAAGPGVGGVAAGGGVPADRDCLAGEHERDRALDRACGAVAGLAGAGELLRVLDRDFNCPSRGVSSDDPRDVRVLFRGDERDVIAGFRFAADEDDGDRRRAGDGVPQAGGGRDGDRLGLAVAAAVTCEKSAAAAIFAGDGRRPPFLRGRPSFPVRSGGRSWRAALARSLAVQVTLSGSCFSSSPAQAEPAVT